jgi:vitamin B12/bleomycin/antimicrobial peptide transport system ATP-binding/permease protein
MRPNVIFLDEASSALDAETERLMYQLLLEHLPHATIVSIAHREAVAKFHQLHWQFRQEDSGSNKMERNARYRILCVAPDKPAAKNKPVDNGI